MNMLHYTLARLKESSTWKGIAAFAAAAGLALSPEHWDAIATAAIGLIGLIEVFRKENK